jgi:hypothetical protein
VAERLSTLRLVCFVTNERDAVHVGLLTPDAQQVVDLAHLGITDVLEAIERLDMLRRAAGAIVHGPARTAYAIKDVHLIASMPLARSVVQADASSSVSFADPTTLHGPGGHMSRANAEHARAGLAAVVGETIPAAADVSDEMLDQALIATTIVLGWPQPGSGPEPVLLPGAVGPFVAVPRRHPESLVMTRVAPLGVADEINAQALLPAPADADFYAVARAALRSHALRPGDLVTIFPAELAGTVHAPAAAGSWIRVGAPGLGTLSLAVL